MWLKAREKLHIKIQKKKRKRADRIKRKVVFKSYSKCIRDLKKNNIMREM